MYRIKKYQYIFYKHFLLHGLNISVALDGLKIARGDDFRVYWLCLNISYVMEFFLQTLVKKQYMKQSHMINMQRLLMLVSTISAIRVLLHVRFAPSILSLFLNFIRRKREITNFIIVLVSSRLIQVRPIFFWPITLAIVCVALLDNIIETMYDNGEEEKDDDDKKQPGKNGKKSGKSIYNSTKSKRKTNKSKLD